MSVDPTQTNSADDGTSELLLKLILENFGRSSDHELQAQKKPA